MLAWVCVHYHWCEFKSPPSYKPHRQELRRGERYSQLSVYFPLFSINSTKNNRKETHFFNTSTTLLTFSFPSTCISTLTSSRTSSLPRVPISGVLSGPGMNCPVPLVSQHYFHIVIALAYHRPSLKHSNIEDSKQKCNIRHWCKVSLKRLWGKQKHRRS